MGSTNLFAHRLQGELTQADVKCCKVQLDDFRLFPANETLLILTSTYGLGEPPANARKFIGKIPEILSDHKIEFSVLGFGSSQYPDFCKFAFDVDTALEQVTGATRLLDVHTVDQKNESQFSSWLKNLREVTSLDISADIAKIEFTKNDVIEFRVLEKSRVDETFTLLIKPLESISFESGDLLGVSPEESKREQERLYSISKTIDNNILLSIRLFSGGLVSPFLEHLEEFDSFWARIISNPSFHLTKDESPLLMISNGTGIVPFIGMLNNSGKRDAHLFWGGRSKKHQTLYDAWLDRVLGRNKNFRFYPAYSRTANGIYVQNLLADESEKVMELWNQNCTVMICGSLAMQREVLLCLEKLIPDINEKSLPHLKKERRLQTDCY